MMIPGPFLNIMSMSQLVGFGNRFWKRPDQCAVAIEVVNNCRKTRKELSEELSENARIARDLDSEEHKSTLALLVQARLASPAARIRSKKPMDLIEHSFTEGGGVETSSEAAYPPKPRPLGKKKPKVVNPHVRVQVPPLVQDPILALPDLTKSLHTAELWNLKFAAIELERLSWMTLRGTTKPISLWGKPSCSRRMCLQRAMASSMRMKKYSSNAKTALKKTTNLDSDLKMAIDKLAIGEAAHQASDASATKYKVEADATQEKLHQALQDLADLKRVAVDLVYEWVFNRGSSQAGTLVDYPAWTAAALEVKLLDMPEAYSYLILSGFNEKENMTQTTEERDKITDEVDGVGTSNELRGGKDIEVPRENQIIPQKCNWLLFP
ncbi:hypothetical protein Acr_00g0077640 [Actinidia rufa]|uniref:Uncharacterized protein n=1 Tax=Actinidia rufa TaxID=165716 RepID=A0A7J0DTM0_9ERIC|nr:hypothetical protein Acr_00g0077640 [Actinidia rufa]